MRVVFFGTPEFAVPSLAALLDGGIEVPLVVTRPDKPVGRHAAVQGSPVAQLAALRGIQTLKPEKIRGEGFLEELRAVKPDAAAVVAYGRILPREVLELPRLRCVNVHASLLPKYRGASPIQAALLAGDRVTGVVTMRIEEELDTGAIYLERRVAIEPGENAGELSERLAREGASLLVETMRRLNAGDLVARPADGRAVVLQDDPAGRRTHRLVAARRGHRAPPARLHALAGRLHVHGPRTDQADRCERREGAGAGSARARHAV